VYSSGTTIWHIIEALYYIYIIRNKLDFCCVSLSFFHTKLFTTKYVFSHDYEIQLFRPNPFQWQFEHGRTLMFVYKMFVVVSLLLVSMCWLSLKADHKMTFSFVEMHCGWRWYFTLFANVIFTWSSLSKVEDYWWKIPNVIRGKATMSRVETWVILAPLQPSPLSQVQTYVLYSSMTVL